MARLERERDTVTVVADQLGSPTCTADLAAGLLELAERDDVAGGVLHATNSGTASWWDLARAVFEEVGADPERVAPTTSEGVPPPGAASRLLGCSPTTPGWQQVSRRWRRGGKPCTASSRPGDSRGSPPRERSRPRPHPRRRHRHLFPG